MHSQIPFLIAEIKSLKYEFSRFAGFQDMHEVIENKHRYAKSYPWKWDAEINSSQEGGQGLNKLSKDIQ